FVASHSKAEDRREGPTLVEIEDALGRVGTPMPHRIQQDLADRTACLPAFAKSVVDRLQTRRRIELCPPENLGRDVDLGVANAVFPQGFRHFAGGQPVIFWAAKEP